MRNDDPVIDVAQIGWLQAAGKPDDAAVGTWEIPASAFVDGAEYRACGAPVWSIGKRGDGRMFAALDGRFYQRAGWECVWLR